MPHMGSMGRQDSVIYRETGGERGGHIWGGLIAPRDAPHKSPLSADVPPAPHRSLRETRCGEREGGRERDEEIKGGGGGGGGGGIMTVMHVKTSAGARWNQEIGFGVRLAVC